MYLPQTPANTPTFLLRRQLPPETRRPDLVTKGGPPGQRRLDRESADLRRCAALNPKGEIAIDQQEALAEVTGGLCYGLLRTFQATARACSSAPSPSLAERQAAFADDELQRFRVLRARLNSLTADPEASMRAFRTTLDAFYDGAVAGDWLEAQVFHFVGDTITADFVEFLSAHVDGDTAAALRAALTGRSEQEAFALEQIEAALADGTQESKERVARFVRLIVGAALNRLRDALLESDALETVLGSGGVKELVLELLGRHRERLERLGLDPLDE